ncbi:hypothetical protein JKG68_26090 [Microvirga aerilata]|uniref:Uncharacterized protein n=1 Tax=Microvirga aerilata TaxID=670292 RepID=A0A936ZML9_9HYPH|nr:hypothetical protein [Microvirga aerilata]MBL0407393.1 hypothetical protein [Microvirga aerilata]
MSYGWRKVAFAVATALTLCSAAQASEISVTVRTSDYGVPHRVADYGEEQLERRQGRRSDYRYEHRDPHRSYEGSEPAWREGRPHHGGYRSIPVVERHHWQRPIFAGPHRGYRETCKVIIKDRVNRWGEVVQFRREICR